MEMPDRLDKIKARLVRSEKSRRSYMRTDDTTIQEYFSGGDWKRVNSDIKWLVEELVMTRAIFRALMIARKAELGFKETE